MSNQAWVGGFSAMPVRERRRLASPSTVGDGDETGQNDRACSAPHFVPSDGFAHGSRLRQSPGKRAPATTGATASSAAKAGEATPCGARATRSESRSRPCPAPGSAANHAAGPPPAARQQPSSGQASRRPGLTGDGASIQRSRRQQSWSKAHRRHPSTGSLRKRRPSSRRI